MLWHRGRCLSYGDGLVFWALAEAVRRRLEIAEEDDPEVVADKLASGLERYVPDPDDRAFIGVRLGRLLGARFAGDPGGELTREELFAGWRRFFERLASTTPVAILIEDAHHAHAELLEFIDHLVDWVRDLPLFVLVFARPEIDERRPGFGSGRNRVSVTLDPLDASSMDALVEALIPGSPAPARSMIVERAQGIPLYAVESIRALIDRDVVRPIDGVYRIVGDVGQLEVPDSLHALLAARLDALDPQVRHVLTGAAVLGSSFPAEAVAGVSGLPSATVDSILGRAAAPRGLAGVRRSAVAGAGQLPLLPGDVAAGRLRDVVAPRPQGPSPRRRRPSAGDVPTRRRGGDRRRRPPLRRRPRSGAR